MPKFQRYFGIRVPVFNEEKMGNGAITIRFVLEGHIVSKKNNESAVPEPKRAKEHLYRTFKEKGCITLQDALNAVAMVGVRFVGNPAYRAFLKKFVPVVQDQMRHWEPLLKEYGLEFPLQEAGFSLKLAFKDKYRTDTVNKMQTIHDLLTKAGAIRDDDYTVLNPIRGFSKRFYKRLAENVSFISLTVENKKMKKEE